MKTAHAVSATELSETLAALLHVEGGTVTLGPDADKTVLSFLSMLEDEGQAIRQFEAALIFSLSLASSQPEAAGATLQVLNDVCLQVPALRECVNGGAMATVRRALSVGNTEPLTAPQVGAVAPQGTISAAQLLRTPDPRRRLPR